MTVRVRLLVAVVVAASVSAGGLALERALGHRTQPPVEPAGARSGAWYCPHGGGEGWRVWVAVANPSSRPAEVRITSWSGTTPTLAAEIVQPMTHRMVEVPAGRMASATAVEYLDATVVAGMVVSRPEDQGGGLAAEPCVERAGTRWYVPEASTLRGETASVVVHNPFAANAVVDVALVTSTQMLRPGRLRGIVLSPGQVRDVDLGRFALEENALTAIVSAPLGRVVAGGVTQSAGGVRATAGVPGPAQRWILPGAGDRSGVLEVTAPDRSPVPIHARAQTAEAESALIDLETVAAETTVAFDEVAREAGIVVEADGPTPFVSSRRLFPVLPTVPPEEERDRPGGGQGGRQGRQGQEEEEETPPPEPSDVAATAGVPAPASSWVVLPPVGPDGGTVVVLVQNPGTRPVDVQVLPLGPDGAGEPGSVTVAPRTTIRVDLPQPAAALIRAGSGDVAVSGASLGHRTYAVAAGVPLG
jgi:Family of unknown function (DUF5719)